VADLRNKFLNSRCSEPLELISGTCDAERIYNPLARPIWNMEMTREENERKQFAL
jgi:hypothetical protein